MSATTRSTDHAHSPDPSQPAAEVAGVALRGLVAQPPEPTGMARPGNPAISHRRGDQRGTGHGKPAAAAGASCGGTAACAGCRPVRGV